MYSFTFDEKLWFADQYFAKQMQKITILRGDGTYSYGFHEIRANTGGGRCYQFTVWALLALRDNDRRCCGAIDTIEIDGYRRNADYEHAWVEFMLGDGSYFVYDPLLDHVAPRDIWYELCKPRDITSSKTKRELLPRYMTPDYAYEISGDTWQFKRAKDVPKEEDCAENGYVFQALEKGHMIGWFSGDSIEVSRFFAKWSPIC